MGSKIAPVTGLFAVPHGNVDNGDGWSSRDRSHLACSAISWPVAARSAVLVAATTAHRQPRSSRLFGSPPPICARLSSSMRPTQPAAWPVTRTYLETPCLRTRVLAGLKAGAILDELRLRGDALGIMRRSTT